MRVEIVKQVTGIKMELTKPDAEDLMRAMKSIRIHVLDRGSQPELKPLYHMYDILKEAGFDQ